MHQATSIATGKGFVKLYRLPNSFFHIGIFACGHLVRSHLYVITGNMRFLDFSFQV